MPSITLVQPVAGTVIDALAIAANNDALENLLNGGLDNNNFSSIANIDFSKIGALSGAETNEPAVWNGSAWTTVSGTPNADKYLSGNSSWTDAAVQTFTLDDNVFTTLGDGTENGRYVKIGKMVLFRVRWFFGSTTVANSAAWWINPPVGTAIGGGGLARIDDSSTGAKYLGQVHFRSGTFDLTGPQGTNPGTSQAPLTATNPITWAQGDELEIFVHYFTS